MSSTKGRVTKVVVEQLGVKEEAIKPEASCVDDLGIEGRVTKIVVEQLGVKEEAIKPEASFVDDLGADSLDTVELVMALEEEFEQEIPDEDAEKIVTVGDVIKYINDQK